MVAVSCAEVAFGGWASGGGSCRGRSDGGNAGRAGAMACPPSTGLRVARVLAVAGGGSAVRAEGHRCRRGAGRVAWSPSAGGPPTRYRAAPSPVVARARSGGRAGRCCRCRGAEAMTWSLSIGLRVARVPDAAVDGSAGRAEGRCCHPGAGCAAGSPRTRRQVTQGSAVVRAGSGGHAYDHHRRPWSSRAARFPSRHSGHVPRALGVWAPLRTPSTGWLPGDRRWCRGM